MGICYAIGRNQSAPAFPDPYTTTFPLTENPVSENGIYTLGGVDGLDWQNPRTTGGTPGIEYASGTSPGQATDNLVILKGRFSPTKHFVEFVIKKQAGYTPLNTHEIEGLVGFDITGHNARGYEWDFGFGQNVQVIRWNGAIDDYTVLGDPNGNLANGKGWTDTPTGTGIPGGLNDGDRVRITFDSTSGSPVMTCHVNGVLVYTVSDTSANKWTNGAPGNGYFARPDASLVLTNYCIRERKVGSA
jgi:hypothetical protein